MENPKDSSPLSSSAESNEYRLPRLSFAVARPATSEAILQHEPERLREGGASTVRDGYNELQEPGYKIVPDYIVWKRFVEESKEHDRDLVDRRNKNLDTMLLFAGLFSAILTAFLVDSTNMMEPNLSETSATLLLSVAQSQWRIETGSQVNLLPPPEIHDFRPTAEVRLINGLWFMALALSLGAAMVAMLAKEWLAEFIASAPTHPLENARERQRRLETLISWHTLRIIDFLPTLLHSSLVLFILGLIIRLWILDRVIAVVIATASAGLFICYIIMVILGATYKKSPYQTRISRHLGHLFVLLLNLLTCGYRGKNKPKTGTGEEKLEPSEVTTEDLRAVLWLITRAMDRTLLSGAFRVLASSVDRLLELRIRENQTKELLVGFTGISNRLMSPWKRVSSWARFRRFVACQLKKLRRNRQEVLYSALSMPNDHQTITTVGLEIANHISKLPTDYQHELAYCNGANVAEYASMIVEIYRYACGSQPWFQSRLKDSHHESQVRDERAMVKQLEEPFLESLDAIWNDKCPPFSATAYAGLTAAELKLTGLVAQRNYPGEEPNIAEVKHIGIEVTGPPGLQMEGHTNLDRALSDSDTTSNSERFPDPLVSEARSTSLSELRARCSRALCRAALLLNSHSNELATATIGNSALFSLLEAICLVVRTDALDSYDCMITHHPQYKNGLSATSIELIVDDNDSHILRPNEIGYKHGLLAALTNTLGTKSIRETSKLETTAIMAMGSIASKLITRWTDVYGPQAGVQRARAHSALALNPTSHDTSTEHPSNWVEFIPYELSDRGPQERAEVTIFYLFQITHFAISFLGSEGICQLPEIALGALCNRMGHGSSILTQTDANKNMAEQLHWLQTWIQSMGRTRSQCGDTNHWSRGVRAHLLRLLAIQNEEETIFFKVLQYAESGADGYCLTQEIFLIVLDNMVDVLDYLDDIPCDLGDVERLFNTVLSSCMTRNIKGCLDCFTDLVDGFDCLQRAGPNSAHANNASKTIADLILFLGEQTENWIMPGVVTGFLYAVDFLCAHPPPRWEQRSNSCLESIAISINRLLANPSHLSEDILSAINRIIEKLSKLEGFADPNNKPCMVSFGEIKAIVTNEINCRREVEQVASGYGQVATKLSRDQASEVKAEEEGRNSKEYENTQVQLPEIGGEGNLQSYA